jgi:FixJ family two-component response regulator
MAFPGRAEDIQMPGQPGEQLAHGLAEDHLGQCVIFIPWQAACAQDAWRVARRFR